MAVPDALVRELVGLLVEVCQSVVTLHPRSDEAVRLAARMDNLRSRMP